MKLIPHNKNVGLFFFGALVLVALFLFVSDHLTPNPSPKGRGEVAVRQGESLPQDDSLGEGLSLATMAKVDWQNSLNAVAPGESVPSDSPVLHVIPASEPTHFRTYAADLKNALRRYADSSLPNEIRIMFAAYGDNNPDALLGIDLMIDLHKETLSDLLAVAVPEQMSFYHKGVMNAIVAITAADEGMKKVFTANDLALAASRAYAANIDSLQNSLAKISSLLLRRGVVLADSEKLKIYLGTNI